MENLWTIYGKSMENLWNIIILKMFEESVDRLFSIAMLRQPEGRKWVHKKVVYIYKYVVSISLSLYIYIYTQIFSNIYIYIFHMGFYEWYMVCKDCEPRIPFVGRTSKIHAVCRWEGGCVRHPCWLMISLGIILTNMLENITSKKTRWLIDIFIMMCFFVNSYVSLPEGIWWGGVKRGIPNPPWFWIPYRGLMTWMI